MNVVNTKKKGKRIKVLAKKAKRAKSDVQVVMSGIIITKRVSEGM
jgi:hypothetical protein